MQTEETIGEMETATRYDSDSFWLASKHWLKTIVGVASLDNLIIGEMDEKLLVPSLKDRLAQSPRLFSLRTITICHFMMHASLKSVLERMTKSRILTFYYLLSNFWLIGLEGHAFRLFFLHDELGLEFLAFKL